MDLDNDSSKEKNQKELTDAERDPSYFNYYAQLTHQQNMLEDVVRTSTYSSAILSNSETFNGKTVCDIGAGSGILSYMAVQAGASKVYAVEASNMALRIKQLINGCPEKNPWLTDKIEIITSKIEEPNLPIPKVDILISEPIGVLLVHERMLESYLYARDHYLKPGGSMFPSSGTIFLAPCTDASLWSQTMSKVRFWEQTSFYGVDFSPLSQAAKDEYFAQPVVGCFDPKTVMAAPISYKIDFYTIKNEEIVDIYIPIQWKISYTGVIHGIGGWFDINFEHPPNNENDQSIVISTAPNRERTHWHQVRFLFKEPLAVNAGETVYGWMRLIANDVRSYTIYSELVISNKDGLSSSDEVVNQLKTNNINKAESRNGGQGHYTRRQAKWDLQNQTYYYAYDPSTSQNDYKSDFK
ncbi:S-adenosyl-L-methionine-dependent methyltransferase [Piromyces finnis]|uniref:type I protein arginine methyltransferase n=1 Tax=Piromyces finnis TaxID=1754191 RepID=A0A1Y1UW84_9FUNG|nr:S-adenosyl-L-methionine-dependent methyltransferase [Piromyces finnis]|eukprot:ORX41876.1 S-adenosyl-L-methionine-dependent methyltransferase [Piromyces finnis]